MKTVFVILPSGFLVRNILSTGIIDMLVARSDLRVIVLTQALDESVNQNQIDSNLFFEQLPKQSRFTLSNFLNKILKIRFDKINQNQALKRLAKKLRMSNPISFFFDMIMSQPFPKSRRIYNWIRRLAENCRDVSPEVQSLFDRYKPSMVLATNPTRMIEYYFLKYAKKMGIKTIGMIKSWDVMLTKGYIPISTDYFLVWTPIMKKDLMRFHNISDEFVGVTGVPQFDIYSQDLPPSQREKSLKKLNLDPQKKTILFSTSSPWIGSQEPKILDCLAKSIVNKKSLHNVQILARLHPMDDPQRYKGISYPHLIYQIPGRNLNSQMDERYLDPQYLPQLRDSLFCSDVVLNTASTMTLDAAALDKPVVNLALDIDRVKYWYSSQRYYEYDHYVPIVESGAVKIARSFDELIAMIIRYLQNPDLEKQERANLRKKMCYKLDGRSAQRTAEYLFRTLDEKPLN